MNDLNSLFDIPDLEDPVLSEDLTSTLAPLPPPPYRTSFKSSTNPNSWPPQLVFDLALGLDSSPDIVVRYDLSMEDLERLFGFPQFRKEVAALTRELRENNTIFRSKAKVQAESYLETMDDLMRDEATPPATKLAIFQSLTKYGDLEPEPKLPASMNSLANGREGQPMRMIVEWAGGPVDHSNIAAQQTHMIELEN